MNSIDFYFLIGSAIFFVFGVRQGIVIALLSLLAVYFSAVVSFSFSDFLGEQYALIFGGGDIVSSKAILFLVLFFVLFFLLSMGVSILKKIINIGLFGPADKWVGGALGVVKGLVIGAFVCDMLILMPISADLSKSIKESNFRNYGESILKATFPSAMSSGPVVSKFFSENVVPAVSNIKIPSFEASKIGIKNIEDDKSPAVSFSVKNKDQDKNIKNTVDTINNTLGTVSKEVGGAINNIRRFTP